MGIASVHPSYELGDKAVMYAVASFSVSSGLPLVRDASMRRGFGRRSQSAYRAEILSLAISFAIIVSRPKPEIHRKNDTENSEETSNRVENPKP